MKQGVPTPRPEAPHGDEGRWTMGTGLSGECLSSPPLSGDLEDRNKILSGPIRAPKRKPPSRKTFSYMSDEACFSEVNTFKLMLENDKRICFV